MHHLRSEYGSDKITKKVANAPGSEPTIIDSSLPGRDNDWKDSALAILKLTLKTLKVFGPLCPPLQTTADGFLALVEGCTVRHVAVHFDNNLTMLVSKSRVRAKISPTFKASFKLCRGFCRIPDYRPPISILVVD